MIVQYALLTPFLWALLVGAFLTIRSGGVQFRALPMMWRALVHTDSAHQDNTVPARGALLTAMSTTLGIGNIIGPVIAIRFGGAGAILCYAVASVLGAPLTFAEVYLAMRYRKKRSDGSICGGPMPYIRAALGGRMAFFYAAACSVMLAGWSASNSNTLAQLLLPWNVPTMVTGGVLAGSAFFVLLGGIQRVSRLNEKIVPFMCVLYCGSIGWIALANWSNLPQAFVSIFEAAKSSTAMSAGAAAFTVEHLLRWGLARAVQANECGVGTAAIPHSMSASQNPVRQGVLAMISVYVNGFICVLTGVAVIACVQPVAGDVLDINTLAACYTKHFSWLGRPMLTLSAVLFGYGTILGNSYNGAQCLAFVTKKVSARAYALFAVSIVFFGAVMSVERFWQAIDYLVAPVVLIHTSAVLVLALRGAISFELGPKRARETRGEREASTVAIDEAPQPV